MLADHLIVRTRIQLRRLFRDLPFDLIHDPDNGSGVKDGRWKRRLPSRPRGIQGYEIPDDGVRLGIILVQRMSGVLVGGTYDLPGQQQVLVPVLLDARVG